jgi:hypothetical protein
MRYGHKLTRTTYDRCPCRYCRRHRKAVSNIFRKRARRFSRWLIREQQDQ